MKATAKRRPSCQRTMNRVLQYVQVATPNRSTFTGGAPQFGQLSAIGPWVPAGTIGPWIGGGGGGGGRWGGAGGAGGAEAEVVRGAAHGSPGGTGGEGTPPEGGA